MKLSAIPQSVRALVSGARARLPPLQMRQRLLRYARIAAGFLLTISLFAVIGVVFVAAQSRVRLDAPASILEAEPVRPAALQAAERLLALRTREASQMTDQRLFAPRARAARSGHLNEAAEDAAIAFLGELAVARGARHDAVAALGEAIRTGAPRAEIAAALRTLGEAAALDEVRFSWRRADRQRVWILAASRLEASAQAIAVFVQQGRDGPARAEAEAAFYRGRGEAYAWALILRGAAMDGADPAPQSALAALDRVCLYQPLFLFNGPADSFVVPNHLALLALDLELAADALYAQAAEP